MIETETHPASMSADSKRNAYCTHCAIIEQAKPYPMCIRLVTDAAAGLEHPVGYEDCARAIKRGTCPAIAMRAEEVLLDKAIYFTDRGINRLFGEVSRWIMGKITPVKVERSKPARRPAAPSLEDAMLIQSRVNGYAEAINTVIKAPVVPDTRMTNATALRGESPLAAARRLVSQQRSSTIES